MIHNTSKTIRLALCAAPVLLAACTSDFGPTPMPTGYKYHNEKYKSAPGPEPVFKKWQHRNDPKPQPKCAPCETDAPMDTPPADGMMMQHGGEWGTAANDLVSRLINALGYPAEGVSIAPAPGSAASAAFESALAGALQSRSVRVAPRGHGPFTLEYSALPLGAQDPSRLMLTTRLAAGGKIASEQSGIYTIHDARLESQPVPLMGAPVSIAPEPAPATHAPASIAPAHTPMPDESAPPVMPEEEPQPAPARRSSLPAPGSIVGPAEGMEPQIPVSE